MSPIPEHAFTTYPQRVQRHVHGAVVRAVGDRDRQLAFIATRQEVDAEGEVIVTRGVDLTRYRSNPVILRDHDLGRPIARATSVALRRVAGADALVGTAQFPRPGVSAEADRAYDEVQAGLLGAVSVGFLPRRADHTPVLPGQRGRTFHETELLEISLVALPACASCLVTGKAPDALDAPGLAAAIAGQRAGLARVVEGLIDRALAARVRQGVERAVQAVTGRPD